MSMLASALGCFARSRRRSSRAGEQLCVCKKMSGGEKDEEEA